MKKTTLFYLLFISILPHLSSTVSADAIIVHPSSSFTLTQSEVSRIFLGKAKRFPNGTKAVPIDQMDTSPIKKAFIEKILKKDSGQLKSFWSYKIFTGEGMPPKVESNDEAVKELVSKNPSIIGYISNKNIDDSIKVLLEY
ncbi:phosphate ABC transporter substrate-binding protein [Zooshikella marina]|uniref:phosphate ABC transporter substrate-binding protein n=1 Tax=Zooshikella ganghwensis TaxID=202772 RepID=UPI001BB0C818|nr:phosphate ABC transporter substrate-binding protein [Zooshikella ganghwensis]MBU2708451.1 phosphate ABC transporter substrate-binding protein [Zooshikella ganghwensis]